MNNPINKVDYSGHEPGDLFDTMDEAAHDFALNYAQLGYKNRAEYASFIYSKKVKTKVFSHYETKHFLWWTWETAVYTKKTVTKYSYVEPNEGDECGAHTPINWFGSKDKVAEVHTHSWIQNHYNDRFSPSDLNKWINYISTPSGTVRKYNPDSPSSESDGAIQIFGDTPRDPQWGKK